MIGKIVKYDDTLYEVADAYTRNNLRLYVIKDLNTGFFRIMDADNFFFGAKGAREMADPGKAVDPLSIQTPKKTETSSAAEIININQVLNTIVNGGDFSKLEGLKINKSSAELILEFGRKKGYGESKLKILENLA